ncbi:MAG: hypothetical protein WCO06_07455 [Candidatus Roizmanbacteria bacterium]
MSIILAENHKEVAESERIGAHPDVFSSCLAGRIVYYMAQEAQTSGHLEKLRADINVQLLAKPFKEHESTSMIVNIGGQVTLPSTSIFKDIAKRALRDQLDSAGYDTIYDFPANNIELNTTGVTQQSPHLQITSSADKFADSCVVYGHYLSEPYGINGIFPSLFYAQTIDGLIKSFSKNNKDILPDGKVHVVVKNQKGIAVIQSVYISLAHRGSFDGDWNRELKAYLIQQLQSVGLYKDNLSINAGGNFNYYFLQADSGVSKAKDDVMITGGVHQLGTDRVWGKCLYKASSITLPYAFSLSRSVAEVLGASYASVGVFALYGQKKSQIILQEIDPVFENKRGEINKMLEKMPCDPVAIRSIMKMPVSLETYQLWNDPGTFHDMSKPWKKRNEELNALMLNGLK